MSSNLLPELAFHEVPESQRTKHVHRLHPYPGKFIPQLVEWFLARFFEPGALLLDPFAGSGTTLIQANEMRMHAIGVEISPFNCLIAQVKSERYNLPEVEAEVLDIEAKTACFSQQLDKNTLPLFETQTESASHLAQRFLQECQNPYLKAWFAPRALLEILYYRHLLPAYRHQDLLRVLLCRAARSARLVAHDDLATPKSPLPPEKPYWCRKHHRYCIPIDNCMEKIRAYGRDTIRRLAEFDRLRSECTLFVFQGDSRAFPLREALWARKEAQSLLQRGERFLDGIFTSPPYLGQLDYHEQHRYAYELFDFPQNIELEIGNRKKGKSQKARQDYVKAISEVFLNFRPFLKPDAPIFVVAEDRLGLYPQIADLAGLRICQAFDREVTKRTQKGGAPYYETIFHMQLVD